VRVAPCGRIEQGEQVPGPVGFAQEGKRHSGPDGAMSILAAILAHAREVAFDVTGIEGGMVERGIEELDQPGDVADEARHPRLSWPGGAMRITGAADDGPALRQGIDLAFGLRWEPRGSPLSK